MIGSVCCVRRSKNRIYLNLMNVNCQANKRWTKKRICRLFSFHHVQQMFVSILFSILCADIRIICTPNELNERKKSRESDAQTSIEIKSLVNCIHNLNGNGSVKWDNVVFISISFFCVLMFAHMCVWGLWSGSSAKLSSSSQYLIYYLYLVHNWYRRHFRYLHIDSDKNWIKIDIIE